MKTTLCMIMLFVVCVSFADVTIWIDGVQRNMAMSEPPPIPPQGFYQDPNWYENEQEYWDYYTNDGIQTYDPNYVDHGLEFEPHGTTMNGTPRLFICHAYKGWHGEIDIIGAGNQVKWIWDNEPEQWYLSDKVMGGANQHYDISIPMEWQRYYDGTVYIYTDVTFADFAECWGYNFPPFDFDKNGEVDLQDFTVFIREFNFWR